VCVLCVAGVAGKSAVVIVIRVAPQESPSRESVLLWVRNYGIYCVFWVTKREGTVRIGRYRHLSWPFDK
jgi:hypothetical protein